MSSSLSVRGRVMLHNVGQHLGVADQTTHRVLVERAVTIRPGGRRKTSAAA
jgi:hypothetical protein